MSDRYRVYCTINRAVFQRAPLLFFFTRAYIRIFIFHVEIDRGKIHPRVQCTAHSVGIPIIIPYLIVREFVRVFFLTSSSLLAFTARENLRANEKIVMAVRIRLGRATAAATAFAIARAPFEFHTLEYLPPGRVK